MTTELSLHHVGEVVLKGLLEGLEITGRLGDVPCKLHSDCSLLSVLAAANINENRGYAVNARLAPVPVAGRTVGFDGEHGVDVLCHDGARGLAMEAKLGLERLSCTAFTKRFLGDLALSTHKRPRFKGSMVAILNFRGIPDDEALPLRTVAPSVELTPAWFLVLRAPIWDEWASKRPQFSNAHVATFEDIARAYGDSSAFDRLVLDKVGDRFHSAWNVFQ